MLFSAGLGGAGAFWQPQVEALTGRYRVILYDQLGTGRSTQPLHDPYAMADMADDVAAVLDAAGAPHCHLVGHALGGLIGLELAMRHPARVRSLTLVNAWDRLDSHTARCFQVRRDLLLHSGPEAYVRAQPIFLFPAAWMSANPERLAREHAHGVAHFQGAETLLRRLAALERYEPAQHLPHIRCPTFVAASKDDMLVPWTASQRLAAALPDARLWLVPEGGHAFTAVDPAPFNTELRAFLDAQP